MKRRRESREIMPKIIDKVNEKEKKTNMRRKQEKIFRKWQ